MLTHRWIGDPAWNCPKLDRPEWTLMEVPRGFGTRIAVCLGVCKLASNPYGLATSTAAATIRDGTSHVDLLSEYRENLYYSLWYYSADPSKIRLHVQSPSSQERAKTAEDFFGQALREKRKEKGLTQEELAFQSGYHPTYIGQLERGQKSPSLRAILGLAQALGTCGSELVKRVERLWADQQSIL